MSVPCDLLLHPELLTNEQLTIIMEQRQLRIPNIEQASRDQLLEVFHHYCVPYGQRRYRDSGRGRILNRNRNLTEENSEPINTSLKTLRNQSSERIKPPPDLLSGHIKRIKISVDPDLALQQDHQVCNHKRKMAVNPVSISLDSQTPPKKERRLITWP